MMSDCLPAIQPKVLPTPLGDELLVYAPETETAHCLGLIGKVVFEACQAGKTRSDLLAQLDSMGIEDSEAVLVEMLGQLAEKGLTQASEPPAGFDRRRFLALSGRWAAGMMVASALAPRPAEAATCYECLLGGPPLFAPVNCLTCGQTCKFSAAGACQPTAVCCFEYRLADTVDNGGVCATAERLGLYGCRSIPASPSVFHPDCGTARANCITAGGTAGTLYYCCSCPGNGPTFSCT